MNLIEWPKENDDSTARCPQFLYNLVSGEQKCIVEEV